MPVEIENPPTLDEVIRAVRCDEKRYFEAIGKGICTIGVRPKIYDRFTVLLTLGDTNKTHQYKR